MGIRPCITFPRPPLKFRTAGFPQYGFKPVVGGNLRPHAGLYAAQASSALAHNSPVGQSPHCVGVEASSVQTHRPRGPWLGSGLCCPAASTLTTASSALLGPLGGLLSFVRRVFASEARAEKVPDLSCVSFDPCRLPYPGGPDGRDCCSSIRDAFALMGGARRPRYSHSNRFMWGDSRGCRVRVMLRPGSLVALHRQGRLLELSPHRVASMDRRAFLRGQQSIAAAGLAPADTQPYRLQPIMSRPDELLVSILHGTLPVLTCNAEC